MKNCEGCGKHVVNNMKSECKNHIICFYFKHNEHQVEKKKSYERFKDKSLKSIQTMISFLKFV